MYSGGLLLLALLAGVQAQGCGRTPIPPNTSNKGVRDINNEIVGGVNAVPYSWPWQIVWCVGNGHCVSGNTNNPGRFLVKAGLFDYAGSSNTESSAQVVAVKAINLHPQYSQTQAPVNDIAVIELAASLSFTDQVQPVCLPSSDSTQTSPPSTGWVTGWGTTSSGGSVSRQLKQVNVPFVSYTDCRNAYGTVIDNNLMTCAGQSGKGDSGGPLVALSNNGSWFEYGIVSFGQGCALAGYPGVYARNMAFCSWISQITRGDVNCARPT